MPESIRDRGQPPVPPPKENPSAERTVYVRLPTHEVRAPLTSDPRDLEIDE